MTKLYPPLCVKCNQPVTKKQIEKDEGVARFQPSSHFTNEDLWFEHTFNCKKMKENYEKQNS